MKTKVNIHTMQQLIKVANRAGKPVSKEVAITFPQPIFTEVPDGSKAYYEFEEFEKEFLNANTKATGFLE